MMLRADLYMSHEAFVCLVTLIGACNALKTMRTLKNLVFNEYIAEFLMGFSVIL